MLKNDVSKPKQYFERHGEPEQQLLLGAILGMPELYPELRGCLAPDHFDGRLVPTIKLIHKHFDTYGELPSLALIEAQTEAKIAVHPPGVVTAAFLRAKVQEFGRYKAMEVMILGSVELLQDNRFSDIEATYQAAKLVGQGTGTAPPFATMYSDETHLVPPPCFLIEPWLIRDTVTAVYGAPETFKSFFCLHAAMCLATGMAFNGSPVAKTCVAYVAAEGQGGIALRQDCWKQHHPVQPGRTDLINITVPVRLLDPAHVTLFIQYLKSLEQQHGIKFGVIVLDTYSQCISGHDESSTEVGSAGAAAMIRIRREMETTVLFVHHTGKDEDRGMRGSLALLANTDGAVLVTRSKDDDMLAQAEVKRIKDAPRGNKVAFAMKVVRIARLEGERINASLVVDFGTERAPVRSSPAPKGDCAADPQATRTLILDVMQPGQVTSVAKLTEISPKMYSNSIYKARIEAALPLMQHCEVTSSNGDVVGMLQRVADTANPQNMYGRVRCVAKRPDDTDPEGLTDWLNCDTSK